MYNSYLMLIYSIIWKALDESLLCKCAIKEMPVLKGRKNPRCALFIGVSSYPVQDGQKYANLSRLSDCLEPKAL